MPAHRQRRGAGHAPALVADEDRRVAVRRRRSRIASSKRGSKPVRYAEVRAVLAVGVDDQAVVAALRPSARGGARAARRTAPAGSSGDAVGHPEVGQVDVREAGRPRRRRHAAQPPAVDHGSIGWSRRARSMHEAVSAATGIHGPDLAVGPGDPDLRVARRRPARSGSSPAAPLAWPPPTVTSRWTVRSPTLTSTHAPIASRFGAGSVQPQRRASGPSAPAPRPCRPPTFRHSLTFSRRVDLDEVQQPVQVEVGERGAAAAREADDAGLLGALARTCRPAGRGAGCSGPSLA